MSIEGAQPGGRRYIITVGTTTHTYAPDLDRPEIVQSINAIGQFFRDYLGYEQVDGFGLNLTRDALRYKLRSFALAPEREPDDYVVLYISGNSELVNDDLILLTVDTDVSDLVVTAVRIDELVRLLLEGTNLRKVLFIDVFPTTFT